MTTTRFTLWTGVFFVLFGIAGFIPPLVSYPSVWDQNLAYPSTYGEIFGLFPSNALHNLVHLAIGIWGLSAARAILASVRYLRIVSAFMAIVTVMGLIPGLNTFFGLMPVYGGNIGLNAIIALVTGYFGYARTKMSHAERDSYDIDRAA